MEFSAEIPSRHSLFYKVVFIENLSTLQIELNGNRIFGVAEVLLTSTFVKSEVTGSVLIGENLVFPQVNHTGKMDQDIYARKRVSQQKGSKMP